LIVFSDESRFAQASDSKYIWRRRGEREESVFADQIKYPISAMFWGAIGLNFKSKLILIKNTIDAEGYKDVLESANIIEILNSIYGPGFWVFQEDGASCHTAKYTVKWKHKRMTMLRNRPANSPDLNPIEHLWGAIKKILANFVIKTKQELETAIIAAWDAFPQDAINRLVTSFNLSLKLII
jgi:hypothetical protein